MKEGHKQNIIFILYILCVLILSVIYFSVPERKLFIENTIKWWSELGDVITGK